MTLKILGFKRVVTLGILLGLNALFALGIYYYLQPQAVTYAQQLRSAKGKLTSTRADIDKLMVEFEQLEQQQDEFNALKEQGFLGSQGRRQAEIIFGEVQRQSQVVSAVANVRAAEVKADETAAKAGYAMLVSPVEIKVQAMDDIDIYRYLTLLSEKFPGHISMDSIEMKRITDVSNPILRGIAIGENVAMVSADFKMSWRTMIPQEEADRILQSSAQQGQKGGRR
ncbi:MAG: hypothetical protein LRY36_01400 [Alphaproteobacteria bacterium]|nr:hypothetical protein [Alphaproteobacteria bacterium]MCD8566573.1 hypothetical protein [Alphaproteobacteria bacterium]